MKLTQPVQILTKSHCNTEDLVESGLNRLQQDGYVVFERFFQPEFTEGIYAAFRERIDCPASYGGKFGRGEDKVNVTYVDHPFTLHPNTVRLATHESFVKIFERYVQTPVVLSYAIAYRTHCITDPALQRDLLVPGAFSGWHSDANLIAPNRGYRLLVSILYLKDVNPGGGALQVIRGSHTYGSQKRAWTPEEVEARKENIEEICAPAGSVILFDMEVIHRAGIPKNTCRDIFRCCYAPEGKYAEPAIFSNETIPSDMNPKVARLLRFGQASSIALPLSQGDLLEAVSLRHLLVGVGGRVFSPEWYFTQARMCLRRVVYRSKLLKRFLEYLR